MRLVRPPASSDPRAAPDPRVTGVGGSSLSLSLVLSLSFSLVLSRSLSLSLH